jgi:alkylhydroperoxidase family enzyme
MDTTTQPAHRIAPLEPPYDAETAEMLRRWMPPGAGVEPLALFRTLALHPELMSRMRPLGSGILGHGTLAARDREIVIQRTCARAGAEYEWGVHATAFGAAAGLTCEEITATATPVATDPAWAPRDAALIALADELHDTAAVSDEVWARLARTYTPEQLLELLVVAGWYRTLAYVINAVRIGLEPWAARFPR